MVCKWLSFVVVLAGYLAVQAGGVLAITRIISGFVPPNAAFGVSLMLLEGALFVTISIAAGTRLSTLANGVLGFGLFGLAFIGGWMEQIGTVLGNGTTRNVGIVASLVVPSESLWQVPAYNMHPPIRRDVNPTPVFAGIGPEPCDGCVGRLLSGRRAAHRCAPAANAGSVGLAVSRPSSSYQHRERLRRIASIPVPKSAEGAKASRYRTASGSERPADGV